MFFGSGPRIIFVNDERVNILNFPFVYVLYIIYTFKLMFFNILVFFNSIQFFTTTINVFCILIVFVFLFELLKMTAAEYQKRLVSKQKRKRNAIHAK